VNVINTSTFTNDGGAVSWSFFDIPGGNGGNTDQHRMVTLVDPLSGKTRIIIGDDQGLFTAVDDNGTFLSTFGSQTVPLGSRNGFSNGSSFFGVTDFFVVTPPGSAPGTGISRTFGLIQQNDQGKVPDPQWPFTGGSNFAVNPINADQIFISSQAGRIFATPNQGRIWTVVGDPSALDGSYAPALAYGAPDPNGPGGADAINFFLYAGTS